MFAKGQSGNPGGRPKIKAWRDALERAVKRAEDSDPEKRPRLELIADACVASALTGDIQAIKEIGDRLDGKPVQALANDDENPLIQPATMSDDQINERIAELIRKNGIAAAAGGTDEPR